MFRKYGQTLRIFPKLRTIPMEEIKKKLKKI